MILVFDFDGTIHRSDIVYKKAFFKSLSDNKIKKSNLDPLSFLGDPPKKIWDEFLDDSFDKDKLIKETENNIIKFLPKYGRLYEKTEFVLEKLHKKYQMYICSSCTSSYIKVSRKIYNLDKYFDRYLIGEEHSYKEKYQILKESIDCNFIMIGDRISDILAGYKNNKQSIFAKYGYGKENEGDLSDYKIEKIEDLLSLKVLS